jgi:hypothetical protein
VISRLSSESAGLMPERSFGKAISASRELAERKGKGEAAEG